LHDLNKGHPLKEIADWEHAQEPLIGGLNDVELLFVVQKV
jgi:hypothetical protein